MNVDHINFLVVVLLQSNATRARLGAPVSVPCHQFEKSW